MKKGRKTLGVDKITCENENAKNVRITRVANKSMNERNATRDWQRVLLH